MGNWALMFVMALLMPGMMFGFGKAFVKKAPKDINFIYGYRTSMSMKNRETWEFAHHYFGKIWYVMGEIGLPVSAVIMLLVMGKDESTVDLAVSILCTIQLIVLMIPLVFTEIALRKNFDKTGRRRTNEDKR